LLSIPFGVGAKSVLGGLALGLYLGVRVSMIANVSEWFARRRKGSAAAFEMYKTMGLPNARPVRIAVILNGYVIGKDEGLIDFSSGALEFYGTKTRFALNSGHEDRPMVGFVMPEIDGMRHTLRISPYERLDPEDDTFREHYYWADYKKWLEHPQAGEVEEVLPPNRPASVKDIRAETKALYVSNDLWIPFYLIGLSGDAFRGDLFKAGGMVAILLVYGVAIVWGFRLRRNFLQRIGMVAE
jgi:hypothetical protein